MTSLKDSIVAAARKEWDHWGRSNWDLIAKKAKIGHTDDEESFARYVIENYCSVGGGNPSIEDVSDDRYFWSAVGMSTIMKSAGLNRSRFPFAQAHSVWIRRFIAARKANEQAALYWGYQLGEPDGVPEVGDLVAYSRIPGTNAEKAAKLFDAKASYPSHSDVVVNVGLGFIEVIGCNVMDSVTMKRIPVSASGHISDTVHAWFSVLKLRGAQTID